MEKSRERENAEQPTSHTVRLPRFLTSTPAGLGDILQRIAKASGLPPCAPCEERAARLNRWLRFAPLDRRKV